MRRSVKVVLGVSAALLGLLAIPVVAIGSAFVGNTPLPKVPTDLGLGVTLVPDGYVSAYLLEAGPGTFIAVDCGMTADPSAIGAVLASRGVDVTAVRAVFLTHGHGDHADGCKAFPRADVYAMAEEVDLIEGRVAPPSPIGSVAGKSDSGARVTHPLKDGDVVTVGDTDVRGYAAPGHTAGSAVYVARGVVFFGDTASSTSDGGVKGAPWVFSDDTAQNLTSIAVLHDRIAADGVAVRTLAFAHTGPLDGLAPLQAFAAAQPARSAR